MKKLEEARPRKRDRLMSRRRSRIACSLDYVPAKLSVERDIAIFPILLSFHTASNNIPSHTRTKQESNSQRNALLFSCYS
jgi:hypothetical protein